MTFSIANAAFIDVDSTNKYYDAINYLESKDVIKGFTDNSFRSNELVTRGQFAKLVIAATYSQEEISSCVNKYGLNNINIFPDVDNSNVFRNYICLAKVKNIINGYSDGYFRPDEAIDSFQGAKILFLAFQIRIEDFNAIKMSDYLNVLFSSEIFKYHENPDLLGSAKLNRGQMTWMLYRLMEGNQIDLNKQGFNNKFYYSNDNDLVVYRLGHSSNWFSDTIPNNYETRLYNYSNNAVKKDIMIFRGLGEANTSKIIPELNYSFVRDRVIHVYNGRDEWGNSSYNKFKVNEYFVQKDGLNSYYFVIDDKFEFSTGTVVYSFVMKLTTTNQLDQITLEENYNELELIFKSYDVSVG
ncbi:S-layer homology domain-containing protein [Candidatus Dojkabacteria bacterium]|nr:S-layer homology domain-containing protein [Candidatus Dojkabacteria bacterium]